jgi:hypothetical protein
VSTDMLATPAIATEMRERPGKNLAKISDQGPSFVKTVAPTADVVFTLPSAQSHFC